MHRQKVFKINIENVVAYKKNIIIYGDMISLSL